MRTDKRAARPLSYEDHIRAEILAAAWYACASTLKSYVSAIPDRHIKSLTKLDIERIVEETLAAYENAISAAAEKDWRKDKLAVEEMGAFIA